MVKINETIKICYLIVVNSFVYYIIMMLPDVNLYSFNQLYDKE